MNAGRWPVAWRGVVVGWIDRAEVSLPRCGGVWVAAADPPGGEFLDALRLAIAGGGGLDVVVSGTVRGRAVEHPDDHAGRIGLAWGAEETR
jgi:hypothetical protein